VKYLEQIGYEPYLCSSEEEARSLIDTLLLENKWPCLFTKSDTTGEKDFEEFFTDNEILDLKRFQNLGIIKNELEIEVEKIEYFEKSIKEKRTSLDWNKKEIVDLFFEMIPGFGHQEKGKYLDSKM